MCVLCRGRKEHPFGPFVLAGGLLRLCAQLLDYVFDRFGVTVTGDAITIDPTDNKIQSNITAQVAELLPKGTNSTSLLKVSPATRPEPNAGGFQVDGASGESDKGRLPTDRPHVFKFYGAFTLDWFGRSSHATEFSTFFTAQSGTPVTSYYQFYSANAVLNGRGDLGRTEAYTQTDFALRHKYRMTERFTVTFDLDFLNLFNESNELGRFTVVSPANLNAGALGITPNDEVVAIQQLFNGGIRNLIQNYLDASPTIRTDARYNLANAFQAGREVRFGVRFLF